MSPFGFSYPLGFLPFGGIGPWEMAIVGMVAVLLFGKRLPDVGRNLGRSLVEFKKGINDLQNEVSSAGRTTHRPTPTYHDDVEDHDEATAPKFEPPPVTAETTVSDDVPRQDPTGD